MSAAKAGWRIACCAALLGLAGALARPLEPALAQEPAGFVPPQGAMKLTRTIEHVSGSGKHVSVTRSWRIEFTPIGRGYRIDGETIAVEVDAPANSAPIAKVERERPDHTFPILLDGAGTIVPAQPEDPGPVPGLTEAAEKVLAEQSPERRAEGRRLVAMLQANGAKFVNRWPEDLFYPAAGASEDRDRIALPDGTAGETVTVFSGTLDSSGHRLARAQRKVTTLFDGDSRTTTETWTLGPLD